MVTETSSAGRGFDTEEELQAHLGILEAEAPSESADTDVRPRTVRDVQEDIAVVREELEHLRARLSIVAQQAETAVKSRAEWANASAHVQLGDYPWLKLAGAMASAFVATQVVKKLPLGSLVAAALPLVATSVRRRIDN
ncbi:hypothetical protein ASE04_04980 [Rhizobium sp. Root708]|uniref:hypothetical protein n=1 Tax=Rhizobium sp. Root708 TaxID=1736592 RepID=UPI000700DF9A|nr:hypothetical protein [Rhizobium sp. Root708]KRB55076.1 hypothetical protein ASE04_04980 [Rhizobium sp. Root708]